MVNERVKGDTLSSAWPTMTEGDRARVTRQTAEYLSQLRELHSDRIQSLDGDPVYSAFLFRDEFGTPHGPFCTDEELWNEMAKALKDVPQKAVQRLRDRMPILTPYAFTHGDLASVNIMVENGYLTGIIDWEASGFFPAWWEYTAAGIGLGEEDNEWKTLLRSFPRLGSPGLIFIIFRGTRR